MQPSEFVDGVCDCGRARRRITDVGVDEAAAEFVGDARPVGVVDVRDDDPGTLCGEVSGHPLADSIATARDEGHLAFEVHERDRRGRSGRQPVSAAGRGAAWTTLRC